MKFTFGIISHPDTGGKILQVISSINTFAPGNEIVVVGGHAVDVDVHVPFNEDAKRAWITKKKNLVTHLATYDNIVYMHDYVELRPEWDSGFVKLAPWDVCMSKIEDVSGNRFRDWVAWDDPQFGPAGGRVMEKWCPPEGIPMPGRMTVVPYDYTNTAHMYVSGAYWIAKKEFMLKHPLNEELSWGEGEDVEWSYRARKHWTYKMNTESTVQFNKPK